MTTLLKTSPAIFASAGFASPSGAQQFGAQGDATVTPSRPGKSCHCHVVVTDSKHRRRRV